MITHVDPVLLVVAIAVAATAVAGLLVGWHLGRRVRRVEAEAEALRCELLAERHAACHDPLTGLPNRRAFYDLGTRLLADPRRRQLVAAVLDLDDFKLINDRYGHAAGDEVLVTVARRFADYAGPNLVARLGGDEFAGLLICPTTDERWLEHARERLAATLSGPIPVGEDTIVVTASVGLSPVGDGADLNEVLQQADIAMYAAKTDRVHTLLDAPESLDRFRARREAQERGTRHDEPGPPVRIGRHRHAHHTPPRQLIDTYPRAEAGG
jgi:diguanylate cyclase (GGDEF)-like protein